MLCFYILFVFLSVFAYCTFHPEFEKLQKHKIIIIMRRNIIITCHLHFKQLI